LSGHAEVLAGADNDLFEHPHEVNGAEERAFLAGPFAAQVDDGIPDKLPGTVIRNVAATVDLMKLDATRGKKLVRGDNVLSMGVAAEREHWRMFKQEECISDYTGLTCSNDLLLNC
jgi:hypothetical protein